MTQSPQKTVTLYQVVGWSEDSKPQLNELEFKDRGGYFVCDGIVEYTLRSADAKVVQDYHKGMSIAGADHPLNEYKDNELWTRDKKLAELAVVLLNIGIRLGLDLAKRRVASNAAFLIDVED